MAKRKKETISEAIKSGVFKTADAPPDNIFLAPLFPDTPTDTSTSPIGQLCQEWSANAGKHGWSVIL